MQILLTAATIAELSDLIAEPKEQNNAVGFYASIFQDVDIFISGIGIANTIFNLTHYLRDRKYDVVVNVGICGSFNKSIPLGAVVNIVEDCFADQLVETGHGVISWNKAGLNANNSFPFVGGILKAKKEITSLNLKPVKAITSDTVHGNYQSIEQIKAIFNPDVESMEGAAVFYVCSRFEIPVAAVRSVSNYVGIRDKSTWKIPDAIQNLTTVLIKLVNGI